MHVKDKRLLKYCNKKYCIYCGDIFYTKIGKKSRIHSQYHKIRPKHSITCQKSCSRIYSGMSIKDRDKIKKLNGNKNGK